MLSRRIDNYDNGKQKSPLKFRLIYALLSTLIVGSIIICKETIDMKSQPHKYDKFAIAIKTGRDIIKERSPILFKTFLSKVDNKILISESPHDPIENVPVIDVFSNLYDGLKDKAGHDLQFIPYSTVNSEKTNHNDLHVKQLEPNESSLGWISDAHKNLPGFRELWERFPKQEWFLMIDDDTYVFMDNLNNFVADYNSSEPFYFGAGNTFVGCDGVKSHADSTMIAHGGSGILISRGAMQRLKFVWDICITKYRDCWAGDVRLGLCLRSVAVLLTNVKLFNTNPPNDNTVFSHPCSKPITFHHMLVSQIEELYTLEIASRNSYLNGHITMEKLLSLWVTADPESDTIRNGDEYESTLSDNLQHCISTCKKDMGCMAYSFEHLSSKCTKQSKINALKKNIGTTTGIIRSNFKCRSEKHALEAKRLMVGL